MKNRHVFLLFLSVVSVTITHCGIGGMGRCEEPASAIYEPLRFSIYNRYTGRDILLDGLNLEINNAKGEAVESDENYWSVSGGIPLFVLSSANNRAYDKLIEGTFFLLVSTEDSLYTDKLDVALKFVENDCEEELLSYLKVTYNDSIYFDGPTNFFPRMRFYKDF